jgi:Asp-tRNA(Asn)/Glu-tRNA(Gln) amidotransferase A subunit family amidase
MRDAAATPAAPAKQDPTSRSALDLRAAMADGELSATAVAEAFLARIAAREPEVGAFAWLNPDRVLAEARARDEERRLGRPLPPLHGVPVALKDIIDTAGIPTENGTPLDAGRRPEKDAAVVRRIRATGAVLLGKTVTTELGAMHPRGTRNPHHPAHTPGGSSSGSAAAVAAGMSPLAIGTQTNGSVIRPASFCGVVGFKPTFGLIPRTGILPQATPLDTVGVFARSVADAALLADSLIAFDASDPDSTDVAPPQLLDTALSEPPVPPVFAFVRTPSWVLAEADTGAAFEALAARLGSACREEVLPPAFEGAIPAHTTIAFAGIARHYGPYCDRGRERLSETIVRAIEAGRAVTAVDYLAAIELREALYGRLLPIFDRYDAILTPATPGEAPLTLETTGNPAFNSLWSLCGVPAITLPLLTGPKGLPVGVQLVARRGDDGRLLRTARWLAAWAARHGG